MYMQTLHTCSKVVFFFFFFFVVVVVVVLHSHGFMEARVFLSTIGICSLNNKHFTVFLKITDYFRENVN